MIEINWPEVIHWMLLIFGGIGTAGVAVGWAASGSSDKPKEPETRSADESPQVAAVNWVADIVAAMGSAPAESKLAALLAGETRDQARSRRIAELEDQTKPVILALYTGDGVIAADTSGGAE